jgi:hypothetical protein
MHVFRQSLTMLSGLGLHVQGIIRSDAISPAGISAAPDLCDQLLKGLPADKIPIQTETTFPTEAYLSRFKKNPNAMVPWLRDSKAKGIQVSDLNF